MWRALDYSAREAAASLWQRRGSAALAMITIAAGVFVLGFCLVLNGNLQRLMGRWTDAAELSVFLADDISPEQLHAVERQVDASGAAAGRRYLSKADAAVRFRQDFPDLAHTADQIGGTPFPASIDVRVRQDSGDRVDALAAALTAAPGVADVRYDSRLLSRVTLVIRAIRVVGLSVVTLLAIAAALTVANVVRLAAHARREEIEIMQLVGAPLAYVRGPFVAEGVLQGGGGALAAIVALWVAVLLGRALFGRLAADVLGLTHLTFLPAAICLTLMAGGMLLGCLGGWIAARSVR